ncbi:MAG: hypothetical protein AAGF71_01935 [Pseudomonadota bacterium]
MSVAALPRLARIAEDPRPIWDPAAKGELCRYLDDFPANVRFGLGLSLAELTEAAAITAGHATITIATLEASIARLTTLSLEETDHD